MYPYDLIFGLGLYELSAAGGILCAMVIFRHLSEQRGLPVRLHNFILADAVLTVVGGYFSAVLTQAFYDSLASGTFSVSISTGSTFLGGLTGGTLLFLAVYFAAGHFYFPDGVHRNFFPTVTDLFAVCIPAAHAFGRIGCLMAGCCHGRPAVWGLYHVNLGTRVIPVQLFESLFLAGLCVFLWQTTAKHPGTGFSKYLLLYGIWRFTAEFFRADDRGKTLVSFLSPSQLTSVLLIVSGLLLLYLHSRKRREQNEP